MVNVMEITWGIVTSVMTVSVTDTRISIIIDMKLFLFSKLESCCVLNIMIFISLNDF